MHNIHELEKKWLRYKIKSYIPSVLITLSITILAVLYISVNNKEILNKKNIEIIKEVVTAKVELHKAPLPTPTKIITKQNNEPSIEITSEKQSEKIILTPSLDFIKKLRSDSTESYSHQNFSNTNNSNFQKQKREENYKVTPQELVEEVVEDDTVEPKIEKKTLTIFKKETQADIEHVIKRFKKNNNPALSLFVAKKYYKIGEYKKAYNYALLTNQIDNNIEQSWIIFFKSLVKINQKDKAIETLNKYIEHSDSSNAKVLLDDIKSGKFK